MNAVVFYRDYKPDMRIIHDDIGDTYETVISSIKKEYKGKRIDILGVKEYEAATKWMRFNLRIINAKKKNVPVIGGAA